MSQNAGALAMVLAGGGLEELRGEEIASSEVLWLWSQSVNEKREPHMLQDTAPCPRVQSEVPWACCPHAVFYSTVPHPSAVLWICRGFLLKFTCC